MQSICGNKSDVDLIIIGDVSFTDVVSALSESESKLGREVNPAVYGPQEFRKKLAAKNHFLNCGGTRTRDLLLDTEAF